MGDGGREGSEEKKGWLEFEQSFDGAVRSLAVESIGVEMSAASNGVGGVGHECSDKLRQAYDRSRTRLHKFTKLQIDLCKKRQPPFNIQTKSLCFSCLPHTIHRCYMSGSGNW